jgi:hypothetical protein
VNDADRSASCDGCSRDLTGLAARERAIPAVQREAARDGSAGRIILVALGFFSAISLVHMVRTTGFEDLEFGSFPTVSFEVSIALVGLFLWFAMARRIHRTSGTALGFGCLYILSLAAALVGSVMLVGLTCAVFSK